MSSTPETPTPPKPKYPLQLDRKRWAKSLRPGGKHSLQQSTKAFAAYKIFDRSPKETAELKRFYSI